MTKDWTECTINELITSNGIFCDGDWVESKDQDPKGNVRLIQLADVGDGTFINKSNRYLTSAKAQELRCTFLKKGDIILARMPDPLGRATIFPLEGENKFVTVVDVAVVRPENKFLDNKYFLFILNSPNSRKEIEALQSGSTRKRISRKNLSKVSFPLPPLPIQRAIVAKIEGLFSSLEGGIADLKKAQEQLKIYRQAVLKKAFEGKLDNPSLPPHELPEGWQRKKIKKVCENVKVGIVIKPTQYYSKNGSGIKAFRSANVREFQVNDSNWVYFTEEGNEQNPRTQLNQGDVLLVRSGYPGTSCVVPAEYEGSNAIDILIATPDTKQILPEYLCAFNNSPLGKGLFSEGSRGVAQKHLNVGVYSNMEISFPSELDKQKQILKEVEEQLSISDKMLEDITNSLTQAKALRQSILKKAFEGKLLSEEEIERAKKEHDYEPADVLLQKIKAEKKKK